MDRPDGQRWARVAQTRWRGETVTAWARGGDGPAAVAVHGAEDSWRSWRALAGRPGRWYALDLPWRAGGQYSWAAAAPPADWVALGLDLVPEPVDLLLGHSFGAGAVLAHLAAADGRTPPPRAALIAPAYLPPGRPVTPELYDRALAGFRRVLAEGMRLRMGRRAEPGLLDAMVASTVARVGPAGLAALFGQFAASRDLDLTSVRVPTLVLAGTEDEALTADGAAALAAAMPAATVRLRPGLGHFCHTEQADEVVAELTDFLHHTSARSPPARAAG